MSFDVAKHGHAPIEIYGETGALIVPDPNYFGGKVEVAARRRSLARRSRHARPTPTTITVASVSPTWRRRSAPGGRIARAANWRCTRSK